MRKLFSVPLGFELGVVLVSSFGMIYDYGDQIIKKDFLEFYYIARNKEASVADLMQH